jgi:hypothetical protein
MAAPAHGGRVPARAQVEAAREALAGADAHQGAAIRGNPAASPPVQSPVANTLLFFSRQLLTPFYFPVASC